MFTMKSTAKLIQELHDYMLHSVQNLLSSLYITSEPPLKSTCNWKYKYRSQICYI